MKVFCAACGQKRPEGRKETHCVPCANVGHNSRLVLSVEDAKRRVAIWAKYYAEQGFSVAQRLAIPFYVRLLRTIV